MKLIFRKIKMNKLELTSSQNKSARRHYEPEFIHQVLGVYQSGVYATVEDCASAYDVPKNTLSNWLRRHRKKSTPDSVMQQQSEITRLKKELAQAKMELEILKKASIYFASQAR